MLSHTRMGVPYEYTHMGHPIRIWANIRIWGRTEAPINNGHLYYAGTDLHALVNYNMLT